MATLTTQQKLDDARAKLHKLVTGSLRVTIRDGDSTLEFTPANQSKLEEYILKLERQLAEETGGTVVRRRPAGVIF